MSSSEKTIFPKITDPDMIKEQAQQQAIQSSEEAKGLFTTLYENKLIVIIIILVIVKLKFTQIYN